jgi:three-Cys-motif partner protein
MFPAPLFDDVESKNFLDGSARIALQVEPHFDYYLFIEKDSSRIAELEELKTKFPHIKDRIQLICADANSYLSEFCRKDWKKHRAVLFLDPYGMQVDWDTIKIIASTRAIDLWILFPLGVAVNRLLKKNAKIDQKWCEKLDKLFGNHDWYDAFYKVQIENGLFENIESIQKTCNFKAIGDYYVKRLKTIFPGVAENPLPLLNSKNVPLFLLCFASANKVGAPTAIRIAQDILKR